MLLISTTHKPATDLGFLLHKNPGKVQDFEQNFGNATVVYPEANEERCTAALILEIDPVALVRGKGGGDGTLDQYVNGRPYAATSYLSVAIGQVFRTAMTGACKQKPELPDTPIDLEARIPVLSAPSESLITKLFAPLGYELEIKPIPLDDHYPEWGESRYFDVTIKGCVRLKDLLTHLYVLIPVLDSKKHYFVNKDEVDKLLSKGAGWLESHPAREEITSRYLRRDKILIKLALERLSIDEDPDDEPSEETVARVSLHAERHDAVVEVIKDRSAKTVLDLGCGTGKLIQKLIKVKGITKILGLDVAYSELERAHRYLHLDTLSPKARERVELIHGSLTYRDKRLEGFDVATVVEVIEHLDPARLHSFERVLFEFARPVAAIVTTPNSEYNALFPNMQEGQMRHSDHRFEWTRAEFENWANRVAEKFNYTVDIKPLGSVDPIYGGPSQMAVFKR